MKLHRHTLVLASLLGAILFSSCGLVVDHRRIGSPLRKEFSRKQSGEEIEAIMLKHIPLGTPRDEVMAYLDENLKRSARTYLDPDPRTSALPRGSSTINSELWVHYVRIYGQFEMNLYYVFDKNQRLVRFDVYQSDAFW